MKRLERSKHALRNETPKVCSGRGAILLKSIQSCSSARFSSFGTLIRRTLTEEHVRKEKDTIPRMPADRKIHEGRQPFPLCLRCSRQNCAPPRPSSLANQAESSDVCIIRGSYAEIDQQPEPRKYLEVVKAMLRVFSLSLEILGERLIDS